MTKATLNTKNKTIELRSKTLRIGTFDDFSTHGEINLGMRFYLISSNFKFLEEYRMTRQTKSSELMPFLKENRLYVEDNLNQSIELKQQ